MPSSAHTRCLALVGVACLIGTSTSLAGPKSERMNFIIILADDLGFGDLSCYGNEAFETPHLDRLAREGLRLTDFHSSGPVCSPTRAGLLTGRYQQRAGIPGVVKADPQANRHHGLQLQEVTFAELLKEAGYATGCFGKWHLGYDPKFNPTAHGFDEFRGYVSGNVDYFSHIDQAGFLDWWLQAEIKDEPGYSTHLISAAAVDFVNRHHDEPFCLYVAHEAPHYPLQGPNDKPFRKPGKAQVRQLPVRPPEETYRMMIQEMDKGIGEIVAAIEKHSIGEQTMVIFLSDNGGTSLGNNGIYRGTKGTVWEGGHRVPAILWSPGRIRPETTSDATTISLDVFPTLLDYAGIPLDKAPPLDGQSLRPVIENHSLRVRSLFWEYNGNSAVRWGNFKYVEVTKGRDRGEHLFDFATDPEEQHDIRQEQPEQFRKLRALRDQFRRELAVGATQQPERATP